jgi:hypothetical protein
MLLVKVRGADALIIGYGPGDGGTPKAIVVLAGAIEAVPLTDVKLVMGQFPKRLRRKLKNKIPRPPIAMVPKGDAA